MSFHLGKPILAMIGIAVVSAGIIFNYPRPQRSDLVVWVFSDLHARSYRDAVETQLAVDAPAGAASLMLSDASLLRSGDDLELPGETVCVRATQAEGRSWLVTLDQPLARTHPAGTAARVPSLVELHCRRAGLETSVKLISTRALDVRLMSLFNSLSLDVPDLAEVEIGSAGMYFRPPVEEVGFLPLNRYLWRDGILDLDNDGPINLMADSPDDRIVRSRFAGWSKEGIVFGIPHDLHPVSISYRKDLFDEAGVDLASARTWDEFHRKCLAFQAHWASIDRAAGKGVRYAIELPGTASAYLSIMLLQRGINLIDYDGTVRLNDPKVADTVVRYTQMAAGPRRIGGAATPGGELWARDFADGALCALITADWRAGLLPVRAPELAGRVGMMPLPRFDPSDAPTATWGGTMIGIPRASRQPDRAWELLKSLYLTPAAARARQRHTRILPATRDQWDAPLHHAADPYFGGQNTGELYIELAGQIPRRYVSPYGKVASAYLAMVQANAVQYVQRHADMPEEEVSGRLRTECLRWLDTAAKDLQRRIDHGKF